MKRGLLLLLLLAGPAWSDRKLVLLKKSNWGYEAEIPPELDFTTYQRRRYAVLGVPPEQLDAVSPSHGLPVRLEGKFGTGVVTVRPPRPGQAPPILPLPLGLDRPPWRGRVRARGLSQDPPRVQLSSGETADLEFSDEASRKSWLASWQDCWLECTCWTLKGRSLATDLQVIPAPLKPLHVGPLRFYSQAGEGFLNRACELYRRQQPGKFRWEEKQTGASFSVEEMGLTTQNCPPGSLRFFGTLRGKLAGLGTLVEGQWEAPATVRFQGADLRLQLNAGQVAARLTRPLVLELPVSWLTALAAMLNGNLAQGVTLPIPAAYRAELMATGALEEAHLRGFSAWTCATGDRRSSFLVVGVPIQGPEPGPDLAASRLLEPEGFLLALSPQAVDAALRTQIGRLLPIRQPAPAGVPGPVTAIDVTALDVAYREGGFAIDNCRTSVQWSLGPFSGNEPAAVLRGTAQVHLQGDPAYLEALTQVRSLEFLSPRILEQSPEDQERLRQDLIRGLAELRLPLPVPTRVSVPPLGGLLQLTDLQAAPDALILQGQLQTVEGGTPPTAHLFACPRANRSSSPSAATPSPSPIRTSCSSPP